MFNGQLATLLVLAASPKESLRFQFCHEQGFDTSCGMTVAATMLDHYWGIPVSELELIETVLGDKVEAGDYTVSLADMAAAFSLHGLSSRAYRLDWDGLHAVVGKGYAPIVVHYDRPEKHFALLLGFNGDRAVTVDPARGMESMSRETFENRYSGMAMLAASAAMAADADALMAAMSWAAGKQAGLEAAADRIRLGW